MTSWKNKKLDQLSKKERIHKTRHIKKTDLNKHQVFIKDEATWTSHLKKGWFADRVVEVHKRYAFVSPEKTLYHIDTSDVWIAVVAKTFLQQHRRERNFIVVGDRVLCKKATSEVSQDLPQCVIEARSPRQSQITRIDPLLKNREHILAANITQLVNIVSYLNPTVKWGLIDRFLVLAEHEHIKSTIIFNKKDLLTRHENKSFVNECQEAITRYQDLGYTTLNFQANKTRLAAQQKKELKAIFAGHLSLVVGHSGVGKSSIVNHLSPEIMQDVEQLDIFRKGRHTTTYASLIKIGIGGHIIDTPGIRSLILKENDVNALSLTWGFVEMRPYLNQCKFRECRHHTEPDCAIIAAVDKGAISKKRYQSYLNLLLGQTGREGRVTLD